MKKRLYRPIHFVMSLAVPALLAGVLVSVCLLYPASSRADAEHARGGGVFLPPAVPRDNFAVYLPLVFGNYNLPIPSIFGAQIYDSLDSPGTALSMTQQAHVYWVRWAVSWSAVEPVNTTPDQYNWSAIDSAIQAAGRVGIHLIVTIGDNPSWAATYANGPIDKVDVSAFAQFMGALAARYNGNTPGLPLVDYWEFYNEEDGGDLLRAEYGAGYWGNFGSQYAQMLCAVYPAIKAASPQAKVALGGLAYDSFTDNNPPGPIVRKFPDDVLQAGGGSCFDAFNFHYYPTQTGWISYGPGLTGKANYLRSKLQSYGLGTKPMIVTEAGWHSGNYSIYPSTPEIQSRYVLKFFAESLASHLDSMIWWTWKDLGGDSSANGLITQSLQQKPSFSVFKTAAEKLNWQQASFQRSLSSTELGSTSLEGYLFSKFDQKPLYVLWSNDDITRTVTLPVSQARITDMYGNVVNTFSNAAGWIQVSVGPNPTYVEVP